jgi:hypothetical protein
MIFQLPLILFRHHAIYKGVIQKLSTHWLSRIAIRHPLGAPRLTTSGSSRLRAQASELAHVLATDPRRLGDEIDCFRHI